MSGAKGKHNGRNTKLYNVWAGMKQRCYYKNSVSYKNYGGRGITICDEWRNSFTDFQEWAKSSGYKEFLMIDRIDNNGNYCPENCRWVTRKEQNNNRRMCVFVTINGETHTLAQWCEINGIPYDTMQKRRQYGWSVSDSVSIPLNATRKRRR